MDPNSPAPTNTTPLTPAGKPITVLCVEDEHFIGDLYTRALTKAGYQVKNVFDGNAGLQESQTDQYDIILLDIMIPNLTGTEILKILRDPAKTPKLHSKIILTTNLQQDEEHKAETEKLADGYIIKADITPKELVAYLQKIKL
ncbi:MAG TPA: response regulator [Candidatus Saccharimonadales bacterium]|nr:response regulator [Candidatus Saccharimonadales bacterium]